jgi:predicted nucleotidyltransferase
MSYITSYIPSLQGLCKIYKVKTLFAFGSSTTDRFSNTSDVDLLVDFEELDPLDYADNYFNLKFRLQDLFNRPVDLLENKSLRNPFLKSQIDLTKVSVYGS